MKNQRQAFTLVELIVVITIIAILGTIAFISLQGYSANARDSTRISDLGAMKTSLELFHLDAGKYPNTTTGFEVTYSGAIVWTQGTFGEITTNNVDKLDKIPKDPLTDKEYTYSVTKTKQEYQLAGLTEGDEITLNNNVLLNQTNAGDTVATAIVTGNYNGQTLKTETGATGEICEILSIPSIISSELETTTTDLKAILDSKSLVYSGYNNLPSNYTGGKYKTNGGFDFESKKLVVYSDNNECKALYAEDPTERIKLIKNLQTAYSGTIIKNSDNISGLIALDISDIKAVTLLSTTLVNNNLGGNITSYKSDILICNSGEHTEDDGLTCTSDTKICSITDGTGEQTWSGGSRGTCALASCDLGFNPSGEVCCQTGSAYNSTTGFCDGYPNDTSLLTSATIIYPCKRSSGTSTFNGHRTDRISGAGNNYGASPVAVKYVYSQPINLNHVIFFGTTSTISRGNSWAVDVSDDGVTWTRIWSKTDVLNTGDLDYALNYTGMHKYWKSIFVRSNRNGSTSCGVGQYYLNTLLYIHK